MNAAGTPAPSWFLGSTKRCKMIHRPTCRHARMPYDWAGDLSPEDLARKIAKGGGLAWHEGCRHCAPDLYDALTLVGIGAL